MRTSDFLLIIIKLIIFYSYKFICLFFKQIKCQSILLYLNLQINWLIKNSKLIQLLTKTIQRVKIEILLIN